VKSTGTGGIYGVNKAKQPQCMDNRGRTGISVDDIHAAYYQIIKVGGNPTIRNVRAMLGNTGSMQTISNGLKSLKDCRVKQSYKNKQRTIEQLEQRITVLESQVNYLLECSDGNR